MNRLAHRLSIEQKNEIGVRIVRAIEEKQDIISKKLEPEMVYRRVQKIFSESVPTIQNYLRLLRIVPENNKIVINDLLSKITNMSVRDERGDTALHILLRRGMVEIINDKQLYKYKLWETQGKDGVMVIDLLLYHIFHRSEKRDVSIEVLKRIFENRSIENLELVKNISTALASHYNLTKDPKILELVLNIPKFYSLETVTDAVEELRKRAQKDDLNLYMRLDHYQTYGKTRILR